MHSHLQMKQTFSYERNDNMVSRREDCSKIIQDLLEDYALEEIAVKLGVSASTVHYWSKGSRKPPMLAVKALRKMHLDYTHRKDGAR